MNILKSVWFMCVCWGKGAYVCTFMHVSVQACMLIHIPWGGKICSFHQIFKRMYDPKQGVQKRDKSVWFGYSWVRPWKKARVVMIEDRERRKLRGLEEAQGWRWRRRSASVTSELSEVLTPLCTKGPEHLFSRKHRSRGDSISATL